MTEVLYVKGYGQQIYDQSLPTAIVWFITPEVYFNVSAVPLQIELVDGAEDPFASPLPQFNSISNALDYYGDAKAASIISTCNAPYGYAYYTSYRFIKVDPAVQQKFDLLAPVATSGSYTDLTNKPSIGSPTFTNPSRSLNTGFQVSTTQNAQVSYSVDISCSMSLTGGQSGTAILEYADNSGFTTNVKTVARGTNANSGTLTIGLALVQVGAANLSGVIPAGKYVRVRTVNNTGTPTFTFQNAQEVLI